MLQFTISDTACSMLIGVLELYILTIKLHGCELLSWIYSNLNYVAFQKKNELKDNITISFIALNIMQWKLLDGMLISFTLT